MGVQAVVKDYDKLVKEIEGMKKAPKKVMRSLMGDVRKRAPGWVAAEVSKHYGVKKAEVTQNKLGTMKVKGDNVQTAQLVYNGRVLTPTHFGMTPKAPGQNAYTLKAEIIRGEKTTLGKVKKLTKKQRAALGKNFRKEGTRNSQRSPIMLMHTGNKQAEGTSYIPFQRKSTDRKDVEAVKTVSLPQMISGRAKEDIGIAINNGLSKRLEHYMDRYMGK